MAKATEISTGEFKSVLGEVLTAYLIVAKIRGTDPATLEDWKTDFIEFLENAI